ncbi:MAG: hypothetical protein ACJ8AT_06170 [Hyalangium sp.]|uniref:hypothetical protein n=1 Tax=Hyalangium sp. TaxID=2028555 RepID=UPI00389AE496
MSENREAVKQSLLKAQWKKMGELQVEGEDGGVTLLIRRPPPKATKRILDQCRQDGLVDAKGEPTTQEAGLEVAARMFAPMLFLPGEKAALFTPEELSEAPWFTEATEACAAALGVKSAVEAAKGN